MCSNWTHISLLSCNMYMGGWGVGLDLLFRRSKHCACAKQTNKASGGRWVVGEHNINRNNFFTSMSIHVFVGEMFIRSNTKYLRMNLSIGQHLGYPATHMLHFTRLQCKIDFACRSDFVYFWKRCTESGHKQRIQFPCLPIWTQKLIRGVATHAHTVQDKAGGWEGTARRMNWRPEGQ